MRSSRHVILVGVGVLLAFGSVAPGSAESIADQSPKTSDSEPPTSVTPPPASVDRPVSALAAQQPSPQPRSTKLFGQAPQIEPSGAAPLWTPSASTPQRQPEPQEISAEPAQPAPASPIAPAAATAAELAAQQPSPQPRSTKLFGQAPQREVPTSSAPKVEAATVEAPSVEVPAAATPIALPQGKAPKAAPAPNPLTAAPDPKATSQAVPASSSAGQAADQPAATAQATPPTDAPPTDAPPNQPVAPPPETVPPIPTQPSPDSGTPQPFPVDAPGSAGISREANRLTPFPYPSLPAPLPTPEIPTDSLPPIVTPPQIGPAKPGKAPASLNANPNPLQFPTKPEEVKLQGLQPITLRQAIELAERNNRNLQIQVETLNRSRAALEEAKAENYPTLNFQTTLSNGFSAGSARSAAVNQAGAERQSAPEPLPLPTAQQQQTLNLFGLGSIPGVIQRINQLNQPSAGAPDPRASTSLSGSLQLSYDLFTSGGRPARIRAAQQQLRLDELEVEVVREQLRLDIAGNYYDLQLADESVRINLAAVRNNEISLRDAQALERAGLGTRFDVLRAEVQLANSRQDLTRAISDQEIQRRQLAQRLSIPQAIDLAAADPVAIAGTWNLTLEESIVLAFKNRAELEQLLAQRDQREQQRKAALAAYGPTVTLNASYEFTDGFNDGVGVRDGYSLSAGLNWNLFDGGAALARARQQEANIAISETQFADTRNQIRFAVEQAYAQLVSNFSSIDIATRALAQANEALRLARLRFQAGVGTQTDVINAETDLTRAEGDRVTAILDYNRALASLLRNISNFRLGDISPLRP